MPCIINSGVHITKDGLLEQTGVRPASVDIRSVWTIELYGVDIGSARPHRALEGARATTENRPRIRPPSSSINVIHPNIFHTRVPRALKFRD